MTQRAPPDRSIPDWSNARWPEATDGLVWGEALPDNARNNFMDLIDTQKSAFDESINRFRSRRANTTVQPSVAAKRQI